MADPQRLAEYRLRRDLGIDSITAAVSAWAIRIHAGSALVADGTHDAADKIGRVLWNDPATGVMRHADAGYDIAKDCARKHKLKLPGILS